MSLPLSEVNYLAVLAGGVVNMALGFVWYGPLFGKLWMRLAGLSEEDIAGGPGLGYLWTFIASLVTALALSLLIIKIDGATFVEGALAGALVAVGFVATSNLATTVFDRKHMGVWVLYAAYQLVSLAVIGGVLAIWR